MKKMLIAAVAATALISTAASASTVFAGLTISKGDIQTAFGWNNHAFQADIAALGFKYSRTADYTGTCSYEVEEGGSKDNNGTEQGLGKKVGHSKGGVTVATGVYEESGNVSATVNADTNLAGKRTVGNIVSVTVPSISASQLSAAPVANGGTCTVEHTDGKEYTGTLSGVTSTTTSEKLTATVDSVTHTFWQQ